MSYGVQSFGASSFGSPSSAPAVSGDASAPGATLTGTSSISAGTATGGSIPAVDVKIAIIGDSIASGRGTNSQTAATSGAYLYSNNGTVSALADPWDAGPNTYASLDDGASALGSFAPRLSVNYQAAGKTTLFIPANKGGTQTADWARSLSTATCYGAMKARLDAVGGADKIIISLGANDAINGVSQATFTTRANQLGANLASDFPGAQIYLVKVHHFAGYTSQIDAIRAGVDAVWGGSSGLLNGGDLDGTSSGLHPTTNGELTAGADVIYAALEMVDATAPGATLTGTSSISAGTATGGSGVVDATAPGATLTGSSSISAGTATGGATGDATAPGVTLSGSSTISAGTATGNQSATAPGATLTGSSSITAGAASNGSYTRAPSGSGPSLIYPKTKRGISLGRCRH